MVLRARNILLTGASGLLGSNIVSYLKDRYNILGLYFSNPVSVNGVQFQKIDLTDKDAIQECVHVFRPDIVVHSAALADVDQCERDPEHARRVNVLGTRHVTESLKGARVKLVYISTDLVYDGEKGFFSETDPVNPINAYGQSKFDGEQEALQNEDCLVLRTNFFGWGHRENSSLAEWIVNNLSQRKRFGGFTDVSFSSIYAVLLARTLEASLHCDLSGIYNCGSRDSLSKYEFAVMLAEIFAMDKSLIEPISVEGVPLRARRAKNLTLNVSKLENALGDRLPRVADSLEAFYADRRKRF